MTFLDLETHPGGGRVQLIATLGPRSLAIAAELASGGATAFRLNASHLTSAALEESLAALRHACPTAPIVVDLQGAKMRLGWIRPLAVTEGDRLRFSLDAGEGTSLPHPEIYAQVTPGDVLSVDDGRVRLRVVRAGETWLEARALGGGTLAPRKGVNVEQHPVRLAGLTPADRDSIDVASRGGVRAFAFSFMETGEEAEWVRSQAPGALVVGKIEREESLRALPAIARRTDAVWVCRGDLGAQLGPARLAREVAAISPGACGAPLLMAGQVLQHLVDHDEPTRSEVCHPHDLLARGYAGIVLSDETAIGRDPIRAVRTASTLLQALTPLAPAAPR